MMPARQAIIRISPKELMSYFAFLGVALKRAGSRWVLTLLSLVSVTLTVSLIASIPVFTDSVGFSILQKELARNAYGNANPSLAMRYYRVPSAPEPMTMQQAMDTATWLGLMTSREVGLPVARNYTQIGSHALMMRALPEDTRYKERELRLVRVNCVPRVEDQIEVLEGVPFAQADTSDELLLWARPKFLEQLGVRPGEVFELFNYNAVHPETPLKFRVAGTWQAKDPLGAFWYRDPHELMEEEFLTSVGAFSRFIAPYMPQQIDYSYWYYVLDEGRIRFADVDRYVHGVQVAEGKAEGMLPSIQVDRSPVEPLKDVQVRTRILKLLLFGFSLPVMVLLLFFVATISSITVRSQQAEIAMMMSRGTSRLQVIVISALEGLVHVAVGAPLGIMACMGLARIMSLNSSFLSFDRSAPLPLATQALDWRLVAVALAVYMAARLVPAWSATRATVVTHGHERARPRRGATAVLLMGDALLVAATAYAYHQLRVRGTFGLVSWQPEGGVMRDPLLLLAPALFVITVGALAAQLFPLVMRLPDLFGALLPGTSLYLGFRNLARESGAYSAPLFLLTVCLCLGAFEASIARGADSWLIDRWHYKVGADYSFQQGVEPAQGPGGPVGQDSWLLPVEQYRKLPGVLDATRVGDYMAIPVREDLPKMRLLGIDRVDLARVTYWRDDYAHESLGELLNRLGQANGLLVTRKFLQRSTLAVGDTLELDVVMEEGSQRIPFVITGVFDYFPTMYEDDASVVVANLDYVYDQSGGIQPHSIWLRTAPDIDPFEFKQSIKTMGVVEMHEMDSRAMIREDLQRLERVGIFGNLTVGFLTGTLLAWLGLLVYTLASLTSRVRQFTVLRAMGLGLRHVLASISLEYLVVIIYGIVVGAIAGIATSMLFVRYFQFTEDPSVQVPPFIPEIAWTQTAWIVLAYFGVLLVAEAIVLLRATRREAFQALRLGDEE
jgi:putative ABC transport system permease protein